MTISESRDSLWFKDAVIYALHVKTFFDSNGDGIGDFRGLIDKLDYLASLGVTCVWLLPFYKSPLRDDGYDVADYKSVDPRFGTLDDFIAFIGEAHRLGLRVITELVLNHTSDAHPWFQRARRAAAGSPERDFYVWSDTDQRYAQARIIFHEIERSNWSWDPVAGAYYWHRFFHHQPDLNYDSSLVRDAMVDVMRFWLDLGVDGLRLDAIAHLYQREGTTCDNLPEVHHFVRYLRSVVDREYPGRVLLAEANQSPEDTRPYFGTGDECHLAFHFPLMPRLFIALKREEALPIVEMVRKTDNLPANCQWALFLRNHDELTLSAVTDEERQFLFDGYAAEPAARLNHGIRRRLAPLLDNDRRRIELANALLLSLSGSPVIYYGDEIGMGDDLHLDDRHSVRTPMQWNANADGGFSRAPRERLAAPPIEDPVYGYRVLNVADEQRDPDSLLQRIARLIHVRRQHLSFGRGTTEFVDCGNPHVLTFIRRHDDDVILVVANVSSTPQPIAVDLSWAAGRELIEIVDDVRFPAASYGPYPFSIGPFACHWFQIVTAHSPLAGAEVSGV